MLILSVYATLHNEAMVVVKYVVTTINVQAILNKSWSSKISNNWMCQKKAKWKREKKKHGKNLDETVFMSSYLYQVSETGGLLMRVHIVNPLNNGLQMAFLQLHL